MKNIKNKRGGSYVTACVYVLLLSLILSVVLFYANAMTTIKTTKRNMQMVLDSFIMLNSREIYDSLREGSNYLETFDEKYCFSEYSSRFSLDFAGNTLYNTDAQGNTVYNITNPNVTYEVDSALNLKVDFTVQLPVYLAGKVLYLMNIPLNVTSSLTLK